MCPVTNGSNTSLTFPSGNGLKASDFEMWFWLAAEIFGLVFNRKSTVFANADTQSIAKTALDRGIDRTQLVAHLPTGYVVKTPIATPITAAESIRRPVIESFTLVAPFVLNDLAQTVQNLLVAKGVKIALTVVPENSDIVTVLTNMAATSNGTAPDLVLGDMAVATLIHSAFPAEFEGTIDLAL